MTLRLTAQAGTSTIAVEIFGAKWSNQVLRGSHPARIDDKGRLKLPTAFKALLEGQLHEGVFITSTNGNSVRVYPMPVWEALEQRLSSMPSLEPAKVRFLEHVNYYGQTSEVDAQGRIVIPPRLRESAAMTGEVDVIGKMDYLEVFNHERLLAKMQREPYTDEDARALAAFGI
jgi:MraZ protein